MSFSSFQFILVFLPLCYAGFLIVHRTFGWAGVYPYLALVSMVFYAQFSLALALVLAASVTLNYAFGLLILSLNGNRTASGVVTATAICLNLLALGYFKYSNFFIDIANSVSGAGVGHLDLIVPIGVSFFTFTQIGFLLEANGGQARRVSFGRYALFATFFPCVTAGPLLLQREMFGQMENRTAPAFSTTALAVGLTMFGMGLFKKVILADSIAPYADVAFDGVAAGATIATAEAWLGALCYTFQLYFDFSGYSDMAIGLGYIFGLKLPLNFNSPFKATSISDFWRRWHMTMTRFFTTYLFTPMAISGTRAAAQRGYGRWRRWAAASMVPVVVTFLLAGVWHGAGWTFVVFGLLHGGALAVNHGWRTFNGPDLGPVLGWLLTMSVVVTGLVIFRAPDLETAGVILQSMWAFGPLLDIAIAFATDGSLAAALADPAPVAAAESVRLDAPVALVFVLVYGAIVLGLPNTQEVLRDHWVSSDPEPEDAPEDDRPTILRWRPTPAWSVAAGALLVLAVASIGDQSGFLYYQF